MSTTYRNRLMPQNLAKTIAAGVLLATAATASAQNSIALSKRAQGPGILTVLGTKLPQVAAKYGKTSTEFAAMCNRDKHLGIDKGANLFYACAAPLAAATPTNAGTEALNTFPTTDTFVLHSKPGATRVIYLDFNGHTTTGTTWNTYYGGGTSIVTPAFDTDGVAASFSTSELSAVQEIWRRVAEDYAAWDVDVTTQEPAATSLAKSTSTDTAFGIRVVVGGDSTWLGSPAGGVAYVNSFSWATDTPAFVFSEELSGYPKYVAEAISHEVGHTLGLNHDGDSFGEYYGGHAGWAPIMGSAYGANVSQFSKGDYTGATNVQDDLAVITTVLPRSLDLAGNDILTAVPVATGNQRVTGIIESAADADLFSVTCGAGSIVLNAAAANPEGNLDIALSLYNGSGNLIATANPAELSASLSTSVTAGTYYIALEGVGKGTATTGYTDYASIGQFVLNTSTPSSSNLPPVAVISSSVSSGTAPVAVAFSSTGSSDPEGTALSYDWDFGDGTSSTLANPTKTYSVAGNYVASLVVYDASGLSATASRTITVAAPVVALTPHHYVGGMTITKQTSTKGTRAQVVVNIKDQNGAVKPNVKVSGKWSGLTTSTTVTGTTNTAGNITFSSAYTKLAGTFTFTVTGATITGSTYDASKNVRSSISIVK